MAKTPDPLDFKRGGVPPQDVTDSPTPLDMAGSPPSGPGGAEGKVTLQTIDSKLDALMLLVAHSAGAEPGAGAPPEMPPAGPPMPPAGPMGPPPPGGPGGAPPGGLDIMSLLGGGGR